MSFLTSYYWKLIIIIKQHHSFNFLLKWGIYIINEFERSSLHLLCDLVAAGCDLIVSGLHTPDGLAIDWVARKMYWTDGGYNVIEVAELDGRNRLTLFNSGVDDPRAIVVDPFHGYVVIIKHARQNNLLAEICCGSIMFSSRHLLVTVLHCMVNRYLFWTDWGDNPRVERSGMDGDQATRLVIASGQIGWPNGLAIDYTVQRIYWADARYVLMTAYNYIVNRN